jgi:hypothetical protein
MKAGAKSPNVPSLNRELWFKSATWTSLASTKHDINLDKSFKNEDRIGLDIL